MFARDAAEVRRARTFVRSSLDSWGLSQQVDDLELAVSELVTNALVHGTGDIEVQLTAADEILRLAVADHGSDRRPHVPDRAGGEPGGWGLHLVDELSDAWGTSSGPNETQVWMERRIGPRGRGDRVE